MVTSNEGPRAQLGEITARNQIARQIIAGFAAEMPAAAGFWRQLDTALADNLTLAAEITRLSTELSSIRLSTANLIAAARATIAAHAAGEPDPLYYIRDELAARQMPSPHLGRAS